MINAAGILFRAPTGRVLLMRRTDTGQWAFPGGHIEEGETPSVAAVREALEETGYLTGHAGVWHTRRVKNGVDFTTFLFDCEDEFKPKLNDEHDAYMWIAPTQALKESASRADDWDHAKHPRDKAGKFVSGIGSGGNPKSANMTQIGPQTGSNPGGLYEGIHTKTKQYVKFYKNPAQAKTEALAGDVLTQMGIGNTKPKFQITNGKESAAADWQPDLKKVDFNNLGPNQKEQLAGLFTAAVLTNNWDVVGLEYDNIAQNADGDLIQMDLGGSFKFRAQGEPKSYDADPTNNFEGLLNKKFQSGKVFSKLFEDHPKLWGVALEALDKINPEDAAWTFANSGMPDGAGLYSAFANRYAQLHDMLASKNLAAGGTEAPAVKAKIGEPVPAGAPAPPAPTAPAAPQPTLTLGQVAKAWEASTPQAQFEKLEALTTPEFNEAKASYSKALSGGGNVKEALDKMKSLAPPGYFEAKAAATKAAKAQKAAAKAAKEAAKAPPPPAPPPPTPAPAPAAPSVGAGYIAGAMAPLTIANQKTFVEQIQKDVAIKVESVLNAESSYEHNKNPEAYKPKLEAAKAAIKEFTEAVPAFDANLNKANTLSPPPPHLKQFVSQMSAYASALEDFVNSKDAIAHAAANAPGQLSSAKQEALAAKQKLQTVHEMVKSGVAPSATAAMAGPGIYGKSSPGGVYPGFKLYKSMSAHKELGKVMKQRKLSTVERKAVVAYKGSAYDDMNAQLRAGKPMSPQQALYSVALDKACEAGTVPANTVLYRGVKDWSVMGWHNPLALAQQGKFQIDNGFISTSSSPSFAAHWAGSGSNAVVMEMKIHRDTHGCHVAEAKESYEDSEQEVVLPRGTIWKTVGHRKEILAYGKTVDIVTLEQITVEDIKPSDISEY